MVKVICYSGGEVCSLTVFFGFLGVSLTGRAGYFC